jgi:hypothetical protein
VPCSFLSDKQYRSPKDDDSTIPLHFNEQKPLKWTDYLVASFPEYNTTGAVSLVFQVYNVREPIVFSLFSGGTAAPVVIARSVNASFADPFEPLHPRVLPGVGASDGSFVIAWTAARSVKKPVRARASECFSKPCPCIHHSSLVTRGTFIHPFAGADLGHHCCRRLPLRVQRHHFDDRAIVAVRSARHRVRIHGFGSNRHGRGARASRQLGIFPFISDQCFLFRAFFDGGDRSFFTFFSSRSLFCLRASPIARQLNNLAPGTTVHYALTDGAGRRSVDYAFTTPPAAGASAAVWPYRFVAFGDLGRGSFDDGITWY